MGWDALGTMTVKNYYNRFNDYVKKLLGKKFSKEINTGGKRI